MKISKTDTSLREKVKYNFFPFRKVFLHNIFFAELGVRPPILRKVRKQFKTKLLQQWLEGGFLH